MSIKNKIRRTKFYRQYNFKNGQKRTLLIGALLIIVLSLMGFGFAYLSQSLNINGNVNIAYGDNVYITSLAVQSTQDAAVITNPSFSDTTASMYSTITDLNGSITYQMVLSNYKAEAVTLSNIVKEVQHNTNIKYEITGINVGDSISAGESKTITITMSYKDGVTTLPTNILDALVLYFDFGIVVYNDYIANNLELNLRGIDEPENSTWVDQANNLAFTLQNVTYNADLQEYNFGTTSRATTGQSLITTTGDFTLEAYLRTPDTLTGTSVDMAVLSQVSDTSNDLGRFKFNIKSSNGGYDLIVFVNQSAVGGTNGTNASYTFQAGISVSTKYQIQLVRRGATLELYLNGARVNSTTISFLTTNALSSGPFKLGYWNTSEQDFTGSLLAVRYYDRALSNEELINNYEVDRNNYNRTVSSNNILTYVTDNQVVTSGSGLYNTATDTYIYKGLSNDNYLQFIGSDDYWRIISFNADGTMKLVNVSKMINQPFDISGNRLATTSSYCVDASSTASGSTDLKGCNIWNARTGVIDDASSKTYLNGTYYSNLDTYTKSYILYHAFNNGLCNQNISITEAIASSQSSTWEGYIGLISLDDVFNSTTSTITTLSTNQTSVSNSWIVNMANRILGIWTMNGTTSNVNTNDVWAIGNGSFGKKRASRYNQEVDSTTLMYFYLYPAIYMTSDIIVRGTGELANPFRI